MSVFRIKTTLVRTTLVVGLAAGLSATLQGCFLLVAGAAGGGALVATDRRTVGAQTEDREIQVKSIAQINQNLPDTAHVNVTVFNRRVLLTGEVPDDASKQKAEQIVRSLNNVTSIVNELVIQPGADISSRANDSYLETRVKTALIAEKNISANNFKVVCENGSVYLMGLVTRDEGARGADVASRVPGVTQVVKVFQYILPQDATAATAAATSEPAAPPPPPTTDATVGAVPDPADEAGRFWSAWVVVAGLAGFKRRARAGRSGCDRARRRHTARSGDRELQCVYGMSCGGSQAGRAVVSADRGEVQGRRSGAGEVGAQGEEWRFGCVGGDSDACAPGNERCGYPHGGGLGARGSAV
jgi:osmotically-inducible protein OsmY